MGKIMLIAAIIISVLGIWLFRMGGPQQLNLADRIWRLTDAADGKVQTGMAYGESDPAQSYDLYYPNGIADGCAGKTYPTLIFFHGGSWRDGDRASYAFVGRAFAERGFHVAIADYRKFPRWKFPAFVEDAASAIAHVHGNLPPCADPGQIFVMGHSAGAHIAMLAALDRKWLAAKGLDSSVIAGVIGLAGPYDFYPFTSEAAQNALGDWPAPAETQPINFARADAPPLLLLTGDADSTVKPRNSKRLAKSTEEAGGRASLKPYPGIGHSGIVMSISRPFRSMAPVVDDVVAFVAQIRSG